MRSYAILLLAVAPCLFAGGDLTPTPDDVSENVNSRYTIESVEITGKRTSQELLSRLSRGLRGQLEKLVGQRYNQDLVQELSFRIRHELRAADVGSRIERGTAQDLVRLFFETKSRRLDEDATVTKLSYYSREGWSGAIQGGTTIAPGLQVVGGLQSEADLTPSRESGVTAQVSQAIGNRVRIGLAFDAFHEHWNDATTNALVDRQDVGGEYRTRRDIEPTVAIALTKNVVLTTGLDFGLMDPEEPALKSVSSNAISSTLEYHQRWNDVPDDVHQDLRAAYEIRSATRLIDSDYIFVRHLLKAGYQYSTTHAMLYLRFMAGKLNGSAPLYDRFYLGNSNTLRGWNKFDIAPAGGSKMVHGSVDYRYRFAGVFYDVGSIGDEKHASKVRNSTGVSVVLGGPKSGVTLAVAFPLGAGGHVDPIFIMSTNF